MRYILNIQFFGGRGASVINPSRQRKRTIKPEDWLEPLDPNATFENTIGKKGDEVGIGVNEKEVNPNYGDGRKWSINCQRCAFTNEFQRRGYNVTALPNTGKNQYYSSKEGIEDVLGRKFEDMGGDTIDNTLYNICYTFNKQGIGSRGFIVMYWKGGGGHIFNIEQTKQGTQFIDSQIHKAVDIRKTLQNARLDSVCVARVDDIPTENFNPSHLKNLMTSSKKNLNHGK